MTDQQPIQQAPAPAPIQQAPTPVPAPAPIQQAPTPAAQQYYNVNEAMKNSNKQTDFTIGAHGAGKEAYQSIIEQQNEQIAALMQQNQALNQQVTQMVQNGAQFNQQAQQAQPMQQAQQSVSQVGRNWAVQPEFTPVYENDGMPTSLAADVDVSLESLAKEIGKKSEN